MKNINLSKQSIHNIIGRGDHIGMCIDISEPLLAVYGKYFNRRDYTACILCAINKYIVYILQLRGAAGESETKRLT